MKRNMKNLFGLLCSAILMIGCSDEFIVQEPEGAIINADQLADAVELNPSLGEATVTGIYATMFTVGTGGTGSQQDFGQKSYDITMDMIQGDMALSLSSFGWWRAGITELQSTQDFTLAENFRPWRYYYRIVNLSNLIIESVGGNDADPEDAGIRAILGQALAMRAHSYFYLTQLYINDVGASFTSPTLPIYDLPGLIGNAKSTTEEVYALMESDLNRAIVLLEDFDRPSKTQVDKTVAQTILAYVLGSRRDRWADVAAITTDALANVEATPMASVVGTPQTPIENTNDIRGGFNSVDAPGWMWGVDINADIGLGLVSWWGHIDAFSFSYAGFGDNKAMDIDLYESMPADDVRREQFLIDPTATNHLQPYFKFYDSDRVFRGSSNIVKADYVYMRYEELLLLNIEALAQSGQEGEARMALESFVASRLESGDATYITSLNGQDLLDEIYKQTRLELWGEGKAYLAMKRNRAITRRGANHLSFAGDDIAFDDERLTYEIPQQEIQDNNNVNDQN